GDLTGLYSNLSKVAQPDLTQIVKAPSEAETNRLVAPTLLVIAVFAVAGGVWWVSALSKKKPQMSETHLVGDEAPAEENAPPSAESQAVSSAQDSRSAASGGTPAQPPTTPTAPRTLTSTQQPAMHLATANPSPARAPAATTSKPEASAAAGAVATQAHPKSQAQVTL